MKAKYSSGRLLLQRGGRAKGGINSALLSSASVCSLSYSASRSRIWPNIFTTNYIQEQACPLFRKVVFPSNVICLCLQTALAGSLQQLTAPAVHSWSKESHHKTKQVFFLSLSEHSGCFQGFPWAPALHG